MKKKHPTVKVELMVHLLHFKHQIKANNKKKEK